MRPPPSPRHRSSSALAGAAATVVAVASVAALLGTAPAAAAGGSGSGHEREGTRSISVAVAANLKPAFEEIASAFRARTGVEVKAIYGASGAFVAQIRNGAPFDLLLSADAEFPARLAEAGLADGEPFTYAFGALVVWIPSGSRLDLARDGLAALADPSVRKIAIANPATAPYGRAAQAALEAAGVYARVKDRLVLGQNASQAAQFAQTGAAQAALIPLSLALTPPLAREGRHVVVRNADRIRQDGVVPKGAREPGLARELAAFLAGPGRATLERHGYAVPAR